MPGAGRTDAEGRASASAARRRSARWAPSHSSRTSAGLSSWAPARAMMTRSTPGGSKSGQVRKHSRQTRLIRLRLTAGPTLPLTTRPIRGGAVDRPAGCAATRSVKCGVTTRRPVRWARTNSMWLRSRRSCPKVRGGAASAPGALDALDVMRRRDMGRGWPWLLLVNPRHEALPALASAIRNNLAAARCGHASAKAVRARPADVVRLICTLHGELAFREPWRGKLSIAG